MRSTRSGTVHPDVADWFPRAPTPIPNGKVIPHPATFFTNRTHHPISQFVDNPAIVAAMTLNGSVADLFRLDGRVALVTGAGGAFGRAIALGFADAGASVFLTDLNSERLEESAQLVRATGAKCETWVG